MKPTVIGIVKDVDGIGDIIASMLAYIGINGITNADYKGWKFEYDNHMIDDCDPNHTIYDVNKVLELMTQNLFGINFAVWRNNTKKYDIKYVYDIKQNVCINANRVDNINQHIIPDYELLDINNIKSFFINTNKNNCVTIKGLCNIVETYLNSTIEDNFLYKRLFREIERDIKFYPFKVITNINQNKCNLVANWIKNANSFTGEVLQVNLFGNDKSYDKECFNLFYQILEYYKQWI